MALFDFKKLKENVGKSAEGLMKTVSDAAADKLPESAKNTDIAKSMKAVTNRGQDVLSALKTVSDDMLGSRKEKAENTKTAVTDALANQKRSEAVVSIKDALRIMYCLMMVDGTISSEEEEKFDEIGMACDPEFKSYDKQLMEECNAVVELGSAQELVISSDISDDYYDLVHDHVGDCIKEENFYTSDGMPAKVLIWNLLTIANSEGDYSANERRLIRYITKKSGVDYAILLEMEHTYSTLTAIEKEEEWLKSSDRSYKVIEERIVELSNRKNTIMQGIKALISD